MKKFILASRSPRRKELLTQQGFVFDVIESKTKEVFNPSLSPAQNALFLAKQKAFDVAQRNKGIILAADTLVVLNNQIFGKPKDISEARHMLQMLSEKKHEVITAFVIYDTKTKKEISKTISTKLKFKKLTFKFIKNYIKTKNTVDKAGAYGIQDEKDTLLENIKGSLTNVMGLPLEEVTKALKKFGIDPKLCSR